MARAVQRHGLAAHHDGTVLAAAHGQWPDAMRVAERHHSMAGNERNDRIRTANSLVHCAHGSKHILGLQRHAARCPFEFVRKHVQQHL